MDRGPQFLTFKLHRGASNILQAHDHDGNIVGHMRWHSHNGEIQDVSVNEELRRQGIATSMLNHAHDLADLGQVTRPVHSPVQTEDGAAWAASDPRK